MPNGITQALAKNRRAPRTAQGAVRADLDRKRCDVHGLTLGMVARSCGDSNQARNSRHFIGASESRRRLVEHQRAGACRREGHDRERRRAEEARQRREILRSRAPSAGPRGSRSSRRTRRRPPRSARRVSDAWLRHPSFSAHDQHGRHAERAVRDRHALAGVDRGEPAPRPFDDHPVGNAPSAPRNLP